MRHREAKRIETRSGIRGVRIVIVDDHPVVRRGLRDLIDDEPDLTVCGDCATIEEAIYCIRHERPDIAIVDLALGLTSGLELVRRIRASHPDVRVLVLSMHDELLFADRALKAGASGYVMKQEAMRDLLTAIRRVASGQTYVSRRVSERVLAGLSGRHIAPGAAPSLETLTNREREVLALIGQGLGTRQIASRLQISVKTVESHCANIKQRFGLGTGRELDTAAVRFR